MCEAQSKYRNLSLLQSFECTSSKMTDKQHLREHKCRLMQRIPDPQSLKTKKNNNNYSRIGSVSRALECQLHATQMSQGFVKHPCIPRAGLCDEALRTSEWEATGSQGGSSPVQSTRPQLFKSWIALSTG